MKSISVLESQAGRLSIDDINVHVKGQEVLRNLSFDVEDGDFVALLGHNGAGKSTLLRTILGLQKTTSGTVSFRGQALTSLATPQIVNAGVSLVPQQRGYFENLTVQENLGLCKQDGRISLSTVWELFPILRDRKTQLVGTMSGGQRQMVAISIALMSNPHLLMLDEPSVGLQPNLVERVMEVTSYINSEYGITVVMVEQNIDKAISVAKRVAVINRGQIVLDRSAKDVHANEIWALL